MKFRWTLAPSQPLLAGKLFAAECLFFHGAQKLEQLPPPGLPEIAFAGRSNVGKSSLVNALTGRSTLARTSSQPGRTKQLNFFDLGAHSLMVAEVHMRLQQLLSRELSLVDLFQFPTVAKLANHLNGGDAAPQVSSRAERRLAARQQHAQRT